MSNSVLETAKNIRTDVINNNIDSTKYKDFQEEYPKFYNMLQKKDMDKDMFEMLLNLLEKNSSNDQNAAAQFSQYGAEKYLYPKFGKPSSSDLKNAQLKIDKLS